MTESALSWTFPGVSPSREGGSGGGVYVMTELLELHRVLNENDAQKRRLGGPWGTLGATWGHL